MLLGNILLSALAAASMAVHQDHSSNWSGYVFSGGPFTSISGTFTVPAGNGACTDQLGEWVGIDGNNNNDLIQAGIGEQGDCAGSGTTYNAWWEILPAAETNIAKITVHPGDSITVSINEVAPKDWAIMVRDNTSEVKWQSAFRYGGPATSAEWIMEAPTDWGGIVPMLRYGMSTWSDLHLTGRAALMDNMWLKQNGDVVSVAESQPNARTLMKDGFASVYTGP